MDRRERGGAAKACWGDVKRDTRQLRQSPGGDEEEPPGWGWRGFHRKALELGSNKPVR